MLSDLSVLRELKDELATVGPEAEGTVLLSTL
jgi:hypothetical protein